MVFKMTLKWEGIRFPAWIEKLGLGRKGSIPLKEGIIRVASDKLGHSSSRRDKVFF